MKEITNLLADILREPLSVFLNSARECVEIPVLAGFRFLPEYSKYGDSGMDVRADFSLVDRNNIKVYGESSQEYSCEDGTLTQITLMPNARMLIPTGIKLAIPYGFEIQARPRSGLALKHGITLTNCVGTIDSGYRGDCGFILQNSGHEPFVIKDGDRIGQFVLMRVAQANLIVSESLEDSDRGDGGYGHTGVK